MGWRGSREKDGAGTGGASYTEKENLNLGLGVNRWLESMEKCRLIVMIYPSWIQHSFNTKFLCFYVMFFLINLKSQSQRNVYFSF